MSPRPDAPVTPVTIITGGTRGIGAAVARRLAADGHRLVLGYRGEAPAAEALAAELRGAGAVVETVSGDLGDLDGGSEAAIEALFAAARGLGAVTGLVNNAGATLHLGALDETPVETIRAVIDLNLTAAVLCARRAVREFTAAGTAGTIVNISSTSATSGSPGDYIHYAAAKAGVDVLTMALAREVGPRGIRVLGVAPGATETRIHADAGFPDRAQQAAARVPLGRAGLPEDVAAAVAWLFQPEAGYLSGTTIRVAGGA